MLHEKADVNPADVGHLLLTHLHHDHVCELPFFVISSWILSRAGALDIRGPKGTKLGILAQLRDLLPGRYAFGLTGRDAKGETLDPGRYRVQLTAFPTGEGPPSKVSVVFAIR